MGEFNLNDLVTFESKTYILSGTMESLPETGFDKFICVG
jgi:hypothetical protein